VIQIVGDRECPECEEYSLVEKGLTKWKCLLCERVYDEKDLDECEEDN